MAAVLPLALHYPSRSLVVMDAAAPRSAIAVAVAPEEPMTPTVHVLLRRSPADLFRDTILRVQMDAGSVAHADLGILYSGVDLGEVGRGWGSVPAVIIDERLGHGIPTHVALDVARNDPRVPEEEGDRPGGGGGGDEDAAERKKRMRMTTAAAARRDEREGRQVVYVSDFVGVHSKFRSRVVDPDSIYAFLGKGTVVLVDLNEAVVAGDGDGDSRITAILSAAHV